MRRVEPGVEACQIQQWTEVEYGCIDNIGVKLFQSSWVHIEKAHLCFNGHFSR